MLSRSGSCRACDRFCGIERNGALEVANRLLAAPAQAQRRRHDVVRVIVLVVCRNGALEVTQGAGVIAGIQRDGRGVDGIPAVASTGGACRAISRSRNPDEHPGALDELAFLGILVDDAAEQLGAGGIVVTLESLHATFVDRDSLVEARLSGRDRSGGGAGGCTGAAGVFAAALTGLSSLTGFAGGFAAVRRAAGLAAGRPFTLVAGPRADRGAGPFRAVAFFFTERGGAPRCCFAKPVCLLPKSVLRRAKVTNWP